MCYHSDFFRATFRGNAQYEEQTDLTVRLPEVDRLIFDLFTQWLYFSSPPQDLNELYFRFDDGFYTPSLFHCAKLFELASFLQCGALIETLETMVIGVTDISWVDDSVQADGPTVQYIYDSFEKDSIFRRALVKLFIHERYLSHLDRKSITDYPQDFLLDVALDRDFKVSSQQARIRSLEEMVKKAEDTLKKFVYP